MNNEQQNAPESGPQQSKAENMMEQFRSLDLQLSDRGVPTISSHKARQLYAWGLFQTKQVPSHFRSWTEALQAIELIQGMGVPAIANLRYVYFVGGHLTAMHKLCLAACQATGELERYEVIHVDANNERLSEKNVVGFKPAACVVYVRRTGRDTTAMGTFSMEQAEKAGIAGKNPVWKAYPADLLMHKASSRALYQHFSDVLQGVRVKEDEEMHLVTDTQGQPVRTAEGAQVYQKRLQQQQAGEQAFAQLKGEG